MLASAAAGEESSHLAFYVLGLVLAGWGVAVAAIGMMRGGRFPTSTSARNLVMLTTTVLVVAACGSAVVTG